MNEYELSKELEPNEYWAVSSGISDPVGDLTKALQKIKNERWICKMCAHTLYSFRKDRPLVYCPECDGVHWHYTYEEKPDV